MRRPSLNSYFMDIARAVSTRATCDRAHVGCVLVRDKRIIATGYNGSPAGTGHCDDVGHDLVGGHCVRTLHAEENALLQCAIHGVSCKGATAYVTVKPCYHCLQLLVGAGITTIWFAQVYRSEDSEYQQLSDKLRDEAGVRLLQMTR